MYALHGNLKASLGTFRKFLLLLCSSFHKRLSHFLPRRLYCANKICGYLQENELFDRLEVLSLHLVPSCSSK